jgi:hypothetical protein
MRSQGGFGVLRLREPIPLPQRLSLFHPAKRVERVGSDAGAILGPGVIPSKNLVVGGEGGVAERQRFGRVAVHPLAAQYGSAAHAPRIQTNIWVCSGQKMMGVSPDQRNRQVHQKKIQATSKANMIPINGDHSAFTRRVAAFTHLQRFPCDARRSRIGRRNNTTMLTELTKLAVASTAATVVVWLLSLIHSGCVPDHVGDLIRFAAC